MKENVEPFLWVQEGLAFLFLFISPYFNKYQEYSEYTEMLSVTIISLRNANNDKIYLKQMKK